MLIEGQGSLCHPGSSATLPLLRGSQPSALLLVHRAGQVSIDRLPQIPLPPLKDLILQMEALASWARPAGAPEQPRVRGIALNTARLDETNARIAVEAIQEDLNLPCTDPIRWGAETLLDAFTRID